MSHRDGKNFTKDNELSRGCHAAAVPDRRRFTNKCSKSEGKWVALAIELCLIVVVPTRS
jgi:hypothetical protein